MKFTPKCKLPGWQNQFLLILSRTACKWTNVRKVIPCRITNDSLKVEERAHTYAYAEADTDADATIHSGVNHNDVTLKRWLIFEVKSFVRTGNGKEHKIETKRLFKLNLMI